MEFAGDKDFPLPPSAVFAKLNDARFLADCVPGRESISAADPRKAVCTQRPGFSFMRGTLEITIEVIEALPDSTIKYKLLGKGIGSSSEVQTVIALAPNDGGTHVHWQAQVVSLGGLLKAVPSGLIQGAAQKIIADGWAEMDKQLQAQGH
jgi:carbon monoxide dehydrogenase subunit G